DGGSDGIAFDESGYNLGTFLNTQAVHSAIMLERSCKVKQKMNDYLRLIGRSTSRLSSDCTTRLEKGIARLYPDEITTPDCFRVRSILSCDLNWVQSGYSFFQASRTV